ncbi:MAG: site-specific DNA-methyltransferase [Candidatus Promineofilum sp.]|nr:site-specific DNA-methyltransferase [Promineifilum sp.]
MKHDIITGDCLDVLPTLPARSVNLVCSSPPYPGQMGNGQTVAEWLDWLGRVARQLRPVLAPSAVVALNVTFKRTAEGWHDTHLWAGVPAALEAAELRCLDVYIWHKTNGAQNGPLAYADAPGYEPVFVYTNAERPGVVTFNAQRKPYATKSISAGGSARIGYGRTRQPNGDGARQTNVIALPTAASDGDRPRARGVSFPLALPARFIRQYTRPGDCVLDFCAGVGTTCRAAAELGRRSIGIEIDAAEAEKARAWLAEPVQVGMKLATPHDAAGA